LALNTTGTCIPTKSLFIPVKHAVKKNKKHEQRREKNNKQESLARNFLHFTESQRDFGQPGLYTKELQSGIKFESNKNSIRFFRVFRPFDPLREVQYEGDTMQRTHTHKHTERGWRRKRGESTRFLFP
jgi:hypothetical protein